MTTEERSDFADLIADLMIKYGPDRHCDGYEIIAASALGWLADRALLAPEAPPAETPTQFPDHCSARNAHNDRCQWGAGHPRPHRSWGNEEWPVSTRDERTNDGTI